MKIMKLNDMKQGWFVGDFEPTAYKTKDFEGIKSVYYNYILLINLLGVQ